MKKFLLILIISIPIIFYAQEDEKSIKKLTLDEFISTACKNSHFEEILIDELNLVYEERLKIPAGDMVLSTVGEYLLIYDGELFQGFKGGVTLSKLFAMSGTTLSGGYSIDPGGRKIPASSITFNVEQSIIKDAFGRISRIKKKIAGFETEIARFQIIEAYEEYLALLMNLYLEWYSSYENLKNAKKALDDSETLLRNIKSKQRYSIAHPIDVNKSDLQVISKKEQYLKLSANYDILLYKIKDAVKIEKNIEELIPDFDSKINKDISDFESEFDLFQKGSRTSLTLQLLKNNTDLSLRVALDDLFPSAKLYGGYSFRGDGYLFENNKTHNFVLGVDIDVPIMNPHERSDHKIKKVEVKKMELRNINQIKDLKIDLKQLYNNIQTEKELNELTEKKVELSKAILKAELKDYNQGRSSMNDLISVYDTLDTNNLAKITHTVQLSKYYIEWLRLTDSLVTNDKEITVKGETHDNIFPLD